MNLFENHELTTKIDSHCAGYDSVKCNSVLSKPDYTLPQFLSFEQHMEVVEIINYFKSHNYKVGKCDVLDEEIVEIHLNGLKDVIMRVNLSHPLIEYRIDNILLESTFDLEDFLEECAIVIEGL